MNDSERMKAFELFAEGFRPSEIYDEVAVKRHTLYWYYQQWKKELKAMQLEIEAEERAEKLQQEADERARRQQQEIKQLTEKLHAIEMNINQYRWYPDNLLLDWGRYEEINRVYSTPEEYLKALEKQTDNLRSLIERRQYDTTINKTEGF